MCQKHRDQCYVGLQKIARQFVGSRKSEEIQSAEFLTQRRRGARTQRNATRPRHHPPYLCVSAPLRETLLKSESARALRDQSSRLQIANVGNGWRSQKSEEIQSEEFLTQRRKDAKNGKSKMSGTVFMDFGSTAGSSWGRQHGDNTLSNAFPCKNPNLA